MKILIIDDDVLFLKALGKNLKNDGHEITSAVNAGEGFEYLGKESFDIIISDIMMPTISGLSFTSVVKEFLTWKTPVILMSSLNTDEIKSTGKKLGAVAFISKPLDFKKLKNLLKEVHDNKK